MRLFISYARVDKPYCIQIADTLDVHDTWYDQRLYAGQNWWKEILRRLDWCEGFVYLLSPDSVESDYCRREFQLAQSLGRPIFPVLIHPETPVPESLLDIQHVDLSKGLTPEAVRILLNSIYLTERESMHQAAMDVRAFPTDAIKAPAANPLTVISLAAGAMEKGQFDQALFLLKQAKSNGYKSRFINIDVLMVEAERMLEQQSYNREAEREYKQIADLMRYKMTFDHGCTAFEEFRKHFPGYDPQNLSRYCPNGTAAHEPAASNGASEAASATEEASGEVPAVANVAAVQASSVAVINASKPAPAPATAVAVIESPQEPEAVIVEEPEIAPVVEPEIVEPEIVLVPEQPSAAAKLPLLDWVDIPAGKVKFDHSPDQPGKQIQVAAFQMSKYPVTNAQYQVFLEDPTGYANDKWWLFSPHAHSWRMNNPNPKQSSFSGNERPREMVNWYDAMAFCHWLSSQLDLDIMLPTQIQWQRAARGDDERIYPWGNAFEQSRCNSRESELKMTTLVMRYEDGVSPFGVYDMSGNVWEWCVNTKLDYENPLDIATNDKRAVQGGSFVGVYQRAQISFYYYLDPQAHYQSIGFRIVNNGRKKD